MTQLTPEVDFHTQIRTNMNLNSSDQLDLFFFYVFQRLDQVANQQGTYIIKLLTKHFLHFINIYAHQMTYIQCLFVVQIHFRQRKYRDRTHLEELKGNNVNIETILITLMSLYS